MNCRELTEAEMADVKGRSSQTIVSGSHVEKFVSVAGATKWNHFIGYKCAGICPRPVYWKSEKAN